MAEPALALEPQLDPAAAADDAWLRARAKSRYGGLEQIPSAADGQRFSAEVAFMRRRVGPDGLVGLEDDPVRLAVRKEASDLATMPGRGWTADIGFASGIYALSDGLEILYVGQSRGITQRLREHARTRPIAWAFASPCAVERLDEVERTIIRSISPPWNSSHAQRRRARP